MVEFKGFFLKETADCVVHERIPKGIVSLVAVWKPCVVLLYDIYHSLSTGYLLSCQHMKLVVMLHRKMISWESVFALDVLIKWKALPIKHDTCHYSSLRTRMFEGKGIATEDK